MLWNILMILLVIGTVASIVGYYYANYGTYKGEGHMFINIVLVIVTLGSIIAGLVCSGINSNDTSKYRHSAELVVMKTSQRDQLASLIEKQVSVDQYQALMAATPQADILVILGNTASNLLLEKAKMLVSLNEDLNYLVNSLETKRIELCAWADNPFVPRFFASPSCPQPIAAYTGK
jgi:hypothetical protein